MLTQLLATTIISIQSDSTLTGNVKLHENFKSEILSNQRSIWVYLPPSYDTQTEQSYKVTYVHDGQNVFDGSKSFIRGSEWRADESAEALINANMIEPIIIVAIANAGAKRSYEYLPTEATFQDKRIGGGANKYSDFVTKEVMPFINKTYRTKTGPNNTALVGASFGGIITLHMGLTKPDQFGMLGVCSPSTWWDDRIMIKRTASWKGNTHPKVWLDMGQLEGTNMLATVRDLNSTLQDSGWKSNQNLIYYEEPNAKHNEQAWAQRFPLILHWFFQKKKPS